MRTTLFVALLALSVLLPTSHAAAQSAQDKAIATEIGNQLKSSGQLRDYRIGVKYKDGVACLSGSVANQQQLMTAVRLTQGMQSVDHVVNNLTISGGASTRPAAPQATMQASYTPRNSTPAAAMRASYPPNGPQPSKLYRQPANQAYMAPRQAMAPQRPVMANQMRAPRRNNTPLPMGGRPVRQAMAQQPMGAMQAGCACEGPGMGGGGMMGGPPAAMGYVPGGMSGAVNYDNAQMPAYAWPSYASYPNYAALSYPQQYSPAAWPYIGPFYPYPQVPLGWRKVCLEWDDGWWFLDFSDCGSNH